MIVRPAALMMLSLFAAAAASGQELSDRKENFGAALAPAALPGGSSAAYAYVGAPEVGGGYRQGIEGLELEARASLDYLTLSLAAEVGARLPLSRGGFVEVAPTLGVGLVYDSGARYFDRYNFRFLGVRPRVGAVASLRLADTVRGLITADLPITVPLSPGGGIRVTPLVGGGAEFYLSEEISALLLGQLGLDAIKEPLGVTQLRPGYKLMLGVGFRLF